MGADINLFTELITRWSHHNCYPCCPFCMEFFDLLLQLRKLGEQIDA